MENPTLRGVIERFLSDCLPDVVDLDQYRAGVRHATRPALNEPWADGPIDAIKRADLRALWLKRRATGVAKTTATASVRCLSPIWAWALDEDLIECPFPGHHLKFPTDAPSPKEFYSREELDRVFAVARSWPDKMAWPFLLTALNGGGPRKCELFGLAWPNVRLDPGEEEIAVVRSYDHQTTKGRKTRWQPLVSDLTVAALREWREVCPKTSEDLVFPVRGADGWRMGRGSDMVGIRDIIRAAGVRQFKMPIHALRRTFGTHYVRSGGRLEDAKVLLGHSSIVTTEKSYVEEDPRRRGRMGDFRLEPSEIAAPALSQLQLLAEAEAWPPSYKRLSRRLEWARSQARNRGALEHWQVRMLQRRRVKLETIVRYAELLGVSPGWLAVGESAVGDAADYAGVAQRLRTTRLARGMGIRTLVTASGVSPGLVSMIEGGRVRSTTLNTVLRLAKALGVDPAWLAFGDAEKKMLTTDAAEVTLLK